ncbi:MAG: hypothetical protein KJZ96_07140 [Rhodocyclaceae bacterium]|nr:hypothetical protein [Rhodocyclaceae bacterium]
MQARQLPPQRGWAWLAEGVRLWRRNPPLLTFASFSYLLMLLVASSIPLVGQPLAFLLMPMLSLGVLNTCRAIDEGRKSGPDILFSGFRSNLGALMTIGGLYLIGNLLALWLSSALDGGLLMRLMTSAEPLGRDEITLADLSYSLAIATALSTPIVMAYWFAPALAGWFQVPASKALFFSFVACVRNWRPFVAYVLALTLFGALLPGLLIGAIGAISPLLSTLALLMMPLVVIPVMFASFYVNLQDVFAPPTIDERIVD